ncbi:unnamed protein product [Coffea canephora]|uniref:Uncharacterized protein n=1 Tax=Coffea canephora TaxID=49390 RepID=A0A068U7U8_COFCA|nr:unnamed protein product [Coffea canephora]
MDKRSSWWSFNSGHKTTDQYTGSSLFPGLQSCSGCIDQHQTLRLLNLLFLRSWNCWSCIECHSLLVPVLLGLIFCMI